MGEVVNIQSREDLVERIDEAFKAMKQKEEKPREYLGASILGHECQKFLWLNFRHAFSEDFSGRMYRLFSRGSAEEEQFVKLLQMLGCTVEHTTDDQLWVDLAPFIGGHPDGVIESGLPGAEKTRHIVEFKTHSDKSFKELKQKGVEKAKPMHYVQMQVYMFGTGISRALYMAVNKNDDELYMERIRLDEQFAINSIARGKETVLARRAPEPQWADPSYYKCQFCPANRICHGMATIDADHITCHTCKYATPMPDGKWHCELYDGDEIPDVTKEWPCHCIHPDLALNWAPRDTGRDGEQGFLIGSTVVINGGTDRAKTTRELLTGTKYRIAEAFNGRVES